MVKPLRLCLAVLVVSVTAQAGPREPALVPMEALEGGRVRLRMPAPRTEPALGRFTAEDARKVLAKFHEDLKALGVKVPEAGAKPAPGYVAQQERLFSAVRSGVTGLPAAPAGAGTGPAQPEEWEKRLRAEYIERYGEPLVPLPEVLEGSPLYLALMLSPRYMPEGVREGMQVLVEDKVFLVCMVLSVGLYVIAWANPEPVFSKAAAAAVTLALALAFGVAELVHTGKVLWNLYQDIKEAKTLEEVERAAERLGKALGGKALRVVLVAVSAGAARGVPPGSLGGLLGRLAPPQLALAGGGTASLVPAWVHVVDGQVVLGSMMMVATAGAAAATATKSTAPGPACRDDTEPRDKSYQWHHLASDKNELSSKQGGPWTPRFERLFRDAGMDLDDPANRVYLKNHKGPHPEAYHEAVYQTLESALRNCGTREQCRAKMIEALRTLARNVCTPGTFLHQLATKNP